MKQLVITKKSKSSSRISTTVRALKHRNFQLFFSGQLISLIGTWMASIWCRGRRIRGLCVLPISG
jgi:hypothetical protein